MKTQKILPTALAVALIGSIAAAVKIQSDWKRVYTGLYNEYRAVGQNKWNGVPDVSGGFEQKTGIVEKILIELPIEEVSLVAVRLRDGTFIVAQMEKAQVGLTVSIEQLYDIPAVAIAKRNP